MDLSNPVIIATVVVSGTILAGGYFALQSWGQTKYDSLQKNTQTQCDIDSFVGPNNPPAKFKVALVNTLRIGNRQAKLTPIPLECTKSEHVPGLYVSRAVKANATDAPVPVQDLLPAAGKKTIVVATIRMGFGHHRLAYSACSWALEQGYTTIFHDLINIESDESKLIGSADSIYSKMSQLSSEMGGPVEWLWGKVCPVYA